MKNTITQINNVGGSSKNIRNALIVSALIFLLGTGYSGKSNANELPKHSNITKPQNENEVIELIRKMGTVYKVNRGDNITKIANKFGVSPQYLYRLNYVLGKKLKLIDPVNYDVLLVTGEQIYVPDNIFKDFRNMVETFYSILVREEFFGNNNGENFTFPNSLFFKKPQSLGFPKFLQALLDTQELGIFQELPRTVFENREYEVGCSNMVRKWSLDGLNRDDLTLLERSYAQKENIDAWMLPEAVIEIGYIQEFQGLMNFMSSELIGHQEPINDNNLIGYKNLVTQLFDSIQSYPEKYIGSLVPFYFKYSKFKSVVRDYNKGMQKKHYNTHQALYAGIGQLQFKPVELGEVIIDEGKLRLKIPNINRKKLQEVKDPIGQLNQAKVNIINNIKAYILSIIKNHEEHLKEIIDRLTNNDENLSKQSFEIVKYKGLNYLIGFFKEKGIKFSESDSVAIISIILSIQPLEQSIEKVQSLLRENNKIDIDDFDSFLNNSTLITCIQEYNDALEIKEMPSSSIVDTVIKFIQVRGDFSGALSKEIVGQIKKGFGLFSHLIKIKVNGEEIDFSKQFELYNIDPKKTIQIHPYDTIEIYGPMLIDGEHKYNDMDPEKRAKLNTRARFFFEFVASNFYIVTEILRPGENSTFQKTDFDGPFNYLDIKYIYSLSKGETLEKKLKELIPLFENLDYNDPNYNSQINYYYTLQIKALQLSGYLSNDLRMPNPGAAITNSPIPYFCNSNIEELYNNYLKEKRLNLKAVNEHFKDFVEHIEIIIFPNDNYNNLFRGLVQSIENSPWLLQEYPIFKSLKYYNRFEIMYFWKIILKNAFVSNEIINFDNLSDGKIPQLESIRISKGELENACQIIDSFAGDVIIGTSRLDDILIQDMVGNNRHRGIIKKVMEIETGGGNIRGTIKHAVRFISPDLINSVGDFQLRFNILLENGWNNNGWITKEQLVESIELAKDQKYREIAKNCGRISLMNYSKDLDLLKKLEMAVEEDKFEEIVKILKQIVRYEFTIGDNIIGKILSIKLLDYKIYTHFNNLFGIMSQFGDDVLEVGQNQETLKMFENIVILINNLGEFKVNLALIEMYIIRIFKEGLGINLQTNDVYSKSVDNYFDFSNPSNLTDFLALPEAQKVLVIKQLFQKPIIYSMNTFISNLDYYLDQTKKEGLNKDQLAILGKIQQLLQELNNISHIHNNKFTMDFVIQATKALNGFGRDQEIKAYLTKNNIDRSMLPTNHEIGDTAFAKSFFNYIHKLNKIEQEGVGVENQEQSKKSFLKAFFSFFSI